MLCTLNSSEFILYINSFASVKYIECICVCVHLSICKQHIEFYIYTRV